jgi:hypothetical protein
MAEDMTESVYLFGREWILPRVGKTTWLVRTLLWRGRVGCWLAGRMACGSADLLSSVLLWYGAEAYATAASKDEAHLLVELLTATWNATSSPERRSPAPNDILLKVLECAEAEAAQRKSEQIGVEHLLLALVRGEDFMSKKLLNAHDIFYEQLTGVLGQRPPSDYMFRPGLPRLSFYSYKKS